jgi:broad specificity phosphatase PhoE
MPTDSADGHFVVEDLEAWDWPARAAIVVRHAERLPISSAIGTSHVPLTDSGHIAAKVLGRTLSRYSEIRLSHSPVIRCEQTAEGIAAGAAELGSYIARIRPETVLGGSYILDRDRALVKADELGLGFVRAWFAGELETGLMRSLKDSLQDHIGLVRRDMAMSGPESSLSVYVTHDWNVSVLREGLFKLRNEDVGWPGYLDGVSFRLVASQIEARYRSATLFGLQ